MNTLQHRRKQYDIISTQLAQLSDEVLMQLLADTKPILGGLGGKASLIDLEETSVFVKKIPLTAAEQLPQHVKSTANLYDLPLCYQYGIGTAGFHAWREWAVHDMTTGWVLKGECAYFPLMYHWRILANFPNETTIQFNADLEKYRDDQHCYDRVSKRVEDLHQATSYLVLFIEYIPQHLYAWLSAEILKGGGTAEAAIAWVDESLKTINRDMLTRGLLHFDEHYKNILIDDGQIYLTDFGLSLSTSFELTKAETEFLAQHKSYDEVCAIVNLLQCIVTTFFGKEQWEARLRELIASQVEQLPSSLTATLKRYAPIALALDEFFQKLNTIDKFTLYPAMELERLLETSV